MSGGLPNERQLDRLWTMTGGQAWEPGAGFSHPFVAALIDGGWVKISTMRCGFEAFDTGLVWSDAAKRYFAARAASGIAARSDETPESGSAEGKSPAPKGDAR
jgi:hypothetical protein